MLLVHWARIQLNCNAMRLPITFVQKQKDGRKSDNLTQREYGVLQQYQMAHVHVLSPLGYNW